MTRTANYGARQSPRLSRRGDSRARHFNLLPPPIERSGCAALYRGTALREPSQHGEHSIRVLQESVTFFRYPFRTKLKWAPRKISPYGVMTGVQVRSAVDRSILGLSLRLPEVATGFSGVGLIGSTHATQRVARRFTRPRPPSFPDKLSGACCRRVSSFRFCSRTSSARRCVPVFSKARCGPGPFDHRVRYPQFNSIIAGQKSTRRGGSAGASDQRGGVRAARAPPVQSNFDRYRAIN
jgi:hypothetical protein